MNLQDFEELAARGREDMSSEELAQLLHLRDHPGRARDALEFAARHYAGRCRSNPRERELDHALRVAIVVRRVFRIANPKYVIVALLHDLMEKAGVRYEALARRFGREIADAVLGLTKPPRSGRANPRPAYQEQLVEASELVKIVKFADLTDNLLSRLHRGDCEKVLESAKSFAAKVRERPMNARLKAAGKLLQSVISRADEAPDFRGSGRLCGSPALRGDSIPRWINPSTP